MIPDLLKIMATERNALIQAIMKSEDVNDRYHMTCKKAKLDILASLLEAWKDEKLGELPVRSDDQLDLEIQMAERFAIDPEKTVRQRNFWRRKLIDMRLLRQLHDAWKADALGTIEYGVEVVR